MSNNRTISSQVFRSWLSTPAGEVLLNIEKEQITALIKKLFGYHLILLGEPSFLEIIQNSAILHHVLVHTENVPALGGSLLQARQDKLPLRENETDLATLAHCLEAHRNPHEVLRETYRVLKPQGHVIITGFNPWSIWGIWRFFVRYIKRAPWDAKFISISRLRDWLALLGFDIVTIKMCNFYLPTAQNKTSLRIKWIEKIGRWVWPFWGSCYVIMAQKRVVTLTQIKPVFEKRRKLMSPSFAETAIRMK